MQPQDVRSLALLLPEVVEGAHKGNPDFRLGGRIFATLWVDEDRLVVRLSADDLSSLAEADRDLLEPVPGAWGRRGWTSIDLQEADEDVVRTILIAAWRRLAPALLDEAPEP
ncbi:MmcQ/YjbR family DNA-binding protein [uncultured Methylobacterium sp.]|uniref:MmcQ/YjbR family DNA-binding protein n=1 Tax=uncultured Methylobacterium sp. TaxID=157278 RepID=UPI0035CA9B24